MRLFEIDKKYIRFLDGAVPLLEQYNDPVNELSVKFVQVMSDFGKHYYNGIVREVTTGEAILSVDFSINSVDPSIMIVDNVRPNEAKIDPTKIVHTVNGVQHSGVDMGYSAMKWLFRQMKQFANSIGFNIKELQSTTRYTGARAKGNTDPSKDEFNVKVNVREQFVYECATDTLTRITYKD